MVVTSKETVNQALDQIYEHFEADFKAGKLSLGGSIYWKELGLEITRYPGDIDMLIKNDDAYQAEFLDRVRSLFNGIIGYHHYEKIMVNGEAKDPIISYTINLPSGIRIELMPNDMEHLSMIKYNHYEIGHVDPVSHLSKISIPFRIYKESVQDYLGAGDVDNLSRLYKKTRKLYTSVLKYIHHFDIPLADLREERRFLAHMQMAYSMLDASGVPYLKIKLH